MARVAVIEDEPALRVAVAGALRGAGHVVGEWGSGLVAPEVATWRPDLAIVDVMLPGVDGFTLVRRLRDGMDVPVIFLTARDAIEDRLTGFGLGGDDYIVKPVALEELLARVTALLRRSGRLRSASLSVGDLVLDEGAAVAVRGGERLELTATEMRLLTYLMHHRGTVQSKVQLLTQVWGYDGYHPNLVEVTVSTLRKKLEALGPRMVHTVRGIGYRLEAPKSSAPIRSG